MFRQSCEAAMSLQSGGAVQTAQTAHCTAEEAERLDDGSGLVICPVR
jgi:hypothetical protein